MKPYFFLPLVLSRIGIDTFNALTKEKLSKESTKVVVSQRNKLVIRIKLSRIAQKDQLVIAEGSKCYNFKSESPK